MELELSEQEQAMQRQLLAHLEVAKYRNLQWWQIMVGLWIDHNGSREAASDRDVVLLMLEEGLEVVRAMRGEGDLAEELADVIMCALHVGHRGGVDVQSALATKLKKNVVAWAPWKTKGRSF